MRLFGVAMRVMLCTFSAARPTAAAAVVGLAAATVNATTKNTGRAGGAGGRRGLQAVHEVRNLAREQKQLESIERAAAVAMCQATKGFDCWRFATAPRGGQLTQVKVFGERQSGARFVRQLVGLNLDVELVSLDNQTVGLAPDAVDRLYRTDFAHTFGWKHSCAPSPSQLEAVRAVSLAGR
jgi:hypothetical protein